jgi:hypothetical protein
LRVIGAITIRLGNCKGPSRNGEKMSMLVIAARFYRKIASFTPLTAAGSFLALRYVLQ